MKRDAILNEIKTYTSKINLQRGKLTVENRKSRQKKTDMLRSIGKQSGESVESVQEKHVPESRKRVCAFLARESASVFIRVDTFSRLGIKISKTLRIRIRKRAVCSPHSWPIVGCADSPCGNAYQLDASIYSRDENARAQHGTTLLSLLL